MSRKCQKSGPRGMCPRDAVDGSDFCNRHSNESDRIRSYRLSDEGLRERFDHHAESNSLETVRNEVVLLRALMEDRLALAKTDAERIQAFSVVLPAFTTLTKLVETLNKLEIQTGATLGKDALNRLQDKLVDILIEELSDIFGFEEIIDRVTARIADEIVAARN